MEYFLGHSKPIFINNKNEHKYTNSSPSPVVSLPLIRNNLRPVPHLLPHSPSSVFSIQRPSPARRPTKPWKVGVRLSPPLLQLPSRREALLLQQQQHQQQQLDFPVDEDLDMIVLQSSLVVDNEGILIIENIRHVTESSPNTMDEYYGTEMELFVWELEKWKHLFDRYDPYRRGEISIQDFMFLLRHPQIRAEMDPHTLDVLEIRAMDPHRGTVSYQEFVNIMTNRRNESFRLAVEGADNTETWNGSMYLTTTSPQHLTCFQRMVRKVAKEFLTDEEDRQFYADRYTCFPPPLFIPIITLLEVGCFVYYCLESKMITFNGPVPAASIFIYRPDKRQEIWRFFLYMMLHAGYVHLFFNVMIQIVLGIPLEMVHGSFRISLVYMAGVLAGSLGTSVFDMDAFLVGSSGGIYALLSAHLANVLLNYSHMELGFLKVAAVFIVASADVGYAIWNRYAQKEPHPPVGYTAHLTGALAGLTVGLAVLKNFQQKLHQQYMCCVALAVYVGCVAFAIFWNVFCY